MSFRAYSGPKLPTPLPDGLAGDDDSPLREEFFDVPPILSDEKVTRLAEAVQSYEDEELFCRVVDLDEIRDNDHNLNITRYVQTDPPPPPIDVKAVVEKLRGLMAERDAAEGRMTGFLEELGYDA